MGLAATQARFLQLTARKTNVEFQGQQINQQRTTLANQTSSYNTQLLSMKVPTPPSSSDFTTTTFSWSGNDSRINTIDTNSIVPEQGDTTGTKYRISYSYIQNVSSAYQPDTNSTNNIKRTEILPATTPATYNYSLNGTNLVLLDQNNSEDAGKLATLRDATANTSTTEQFYKYQHSDGSYSYYSADDIADVNTSWDNNGYAPINKYLIGAHDETRDVTNALATLTMNNSGRMTNITINNNTYAINTKTTIDDAAYKDAMNQYEYDNAKYNQEMDQINAKLSIIQQQDKTLELQLKAVDTEQEAISTEMDAVKKVADKNIEGTFKTFG